MKNIYLFLLVFFSIPLFSQNSLTLNTGKDFWLTSFPTGPVERFGNLDTAVIFIASKYSCNGYVENHHTGYRQTFTVSPLQVTEIKIPAAHIMCIEDTGVQRKAVHLHTEQEAYVFLQNTTKDCDLPGSINEYVNTTKISISPTRIFNEELHLPRNLNYLLGVYAVGTVYDAIIATEDSTLLTIWDDNNPGIVESTILLQKGEIYVKSGTTTVYDGEYCKQKVSSNCKTIIGYQHYKAFDVINPNFPKLNFNSLWQINQDQSSGNHFLSFRESLFPFSYHKYHFYVHNAGNNATITSNQFTTPDVSYNCANSYFLDQTGAIFINSDVPVNMLFTNITFPGEGISESTPMPPIDIPAERKVKEMIFIPKVITTPSTDNMFVEINIVTSPQGIHSTYINDSLIPSSNFQSDPAFQHLYYYTRITYRDNAPDIIHIENPQGFMATMMELGHYVSNNASGRDIKFNHIGLCHSGGSGSAASALDELELSPIRCSGDTLHLQALNNRYQYPLDWIIDGREYLQSDEVFFPLPVGDSVIVSLIVHRNACKDTITKVVYLDLPLTILDIPGDTVLCYGDLISVHSPNARYYHWNHGAEGAEIPVYESGQYIVTASNACLKKMTDSINIQVFPPLEVYLGNDTMLCTAASLFLDATNPHAQTYLWQDDSHDATYTVLYDGEYWVKVTDNCSQMSDTINVGYLDYVSISLGQDKVLCEDEVVVLDVSTPHCNYLWHDGRQDSIRTITFSGTYAVTVSNLCNSATDEVTLFFEDCSRHVYIPNCFSPDGDGLNDLFVPVFRYPEEIEMYCMKIYDRWGKLIFLSKDILQGWDGKAALSGTYIYTIEYKFHSLAPRITKGSIMLLR